MAAPPPAAGGGGTLPPGFKLPQGKYRIVSFRLDGINRRPEGLNGKTNLTGGNGISDVKMNRRMALSGVFLGPRAPIGKTPPATNLTNRPQIGQIFYTVLKSESGTPVEFTVPQGATRLFLGVADGNNGFQGAPGGYADNTEDSKHRRSSR